jgi:hypothetical protein
MTVLMIGLAAGVLRMMPVARSGVFTISRTRSFFLPPPAATAALAGSTTSSCFVFAAFLKASQPAVSPLDIVKGDLQCDSLDQRNALPTKATTGSVRVCQRSQRRQCHS